MKRAKAWNISDGGHPQPLESSSVPYEKDLENWIEDDVTIAVDDILLIGRQIQTSWATKLDLLGIDAEGNLVILELKRKQTLRDTVAQARVCRMGLKADRRKRACYRRREVQGTGILRGCLS